uniref:Uncharacterized mitochondrial protein AtMg00810-like n=1 Tax=Nicotiana tabacum TaxID=4097 RepID=A0A1S4DKB7_TOBAC|nr:PREDICTED: uncharacterized mitochondrial protein AtMg00810-like [Nicotiana tabacum]
MVPNGNLVCMLRKSLYGLKQASRQCYYKLTESLHSRGFMHSTSDYSLFYKKHRTSTVFVAVYVDDVIVIGTNFEEIKELKVFSHNQFKIKDLGKLHYFLGLEMLYKTDEVLICQEKFTMDLLKEYDCLTYSPVSSPLDSTIKLRSEDGALLSDRGYYRKLVGKLNFLTNTRLDIAYSVQHLSQFMKTPREPHLKADIHVLRYLKKDPTLEIFLSNDPNYTFSTYCDSDWAACPDSRKSVSGYVVLLGNNPISWKSKKKTTILLSSAEAEYRSIRKVVGELIWVKRLLEELTVMCANPITEQCSVIVRQLYILQETLYSMKGQSISKWIATLSGTRYRRGYLNCITSPPPLN